MTKCTRKKKREDINNTQNILEHWKLSFPQMPFSLFGSAGDNCVTVVKGKVPVLELKLPSGSKVSAFSSAGKGSKTVFQETPDTCTLIEEKGDLFTVLDNRDKKLSAAVAHCISADRKMGAGIAVAFKKKFGVPKPTSDGKKIGVVWPIELARERLTVYNLVTKHKANDLPSRMAIFATLLEMFADMKEKKIDVVYMPRIACGLDRQKWSIVRESINEAAEYQGFKGTVRVVQLNK